MYLLLSSKTAEKSVSLGYNLRPDKAASCEAFFRNTMHVPILPARGAMGARLASTTFAKISYL